MAGRGGGGRSPRSPGTSTASWLPDAAAAAGTGAALLQWAAHQARAQGRSLLRLDCGEDNDALRRYYAQQGLRPVGRRDTEGRWYCVVLLERPL